MAFGEIALEVDGVDVSWSLESDLTRVPLAFVGRGVARRRLDPGVTLDRIAPTMASLAGIRRRHPEDRSGEAIPEVALPGARPPLLVVIAWKGVGNETLERRDDAWPELRALIREGASTRLARTGSVPVDPTAVLSTIGSGALPSDHGVTGSIVSTDGGDAVPAWSDRAPLPVIAFLGDDLDEATGEHARVGIVAADPSDRGLIGGEWYLGHDRDDVAVGGDPLRAVRRLLDTGYGSADGAVDLLAVSLRGAVPTLDRTTGAIVRLVRSRVPAAVSIITATGEAPGAASADAAVLAADIDREIGTSGAVAALGSAGFFLDPKAGVSADDAARAAQRIGEASGDGLVAFPSYAVSLGRFC
jgi:hypothetical protein